MKRPCELFFSPMKFPLIKLVCDLDIKMSSTFLNCLQLLKRLFCIRPIVRDWPSILQKFTGLISFRETAYDATSK